MRELVSKLMPANYKARPEQVVLFTVAARDQLPATYSATLRGR